MPVLKPSAEEYGAQMRGMFPFGRLFPRAVTAVLIALLNGCGEVLARISGRAYDLVEESDVRTAIELLPEFESQLGLTSEGTTDDRRARAIALLIKFQGARPVDFQNALAPVLELDPVDVEVIETSRATAILVGDDRIIYKFYIFRDPALPGSPQLAFAQSMVDTMAHSHTLGTVIESKNFLFDDPSSLIDRDLFGS